MNPLIPTVFSADPSAHVWPGDDRIWLYASHDEPGTNTHDTMQSYHVFSSDDMTNWTDHGRVLHLDQVSWASSHMWAIDAAYRDGVYYLVYCAVESATGMFRTGLATSDQPQGPFTDIGFIEGVEWGQDPALFIDDDSTPYLFWGAGGHCSACRLTDDLRAAVPETIVDLTPQLKWVFEGPFVHKYNGKYYLSYPGLFEDKWPEHMYYATADHPLGPYTFGGEYIPVFSGQAGTNHGSIIEYKGQWYAFHHSMWVSHMSECRSLMCDYLTYNADGSIQPIYPCTIGVFNLKTGSDKGTVTILLDASVADRTGGKFSGTHPATQRDGYTGHGYCTGFDRNEKGVTVLIQSCIDRLGRLSIRYCAPDGDVRMKVMLNHVLLAPAGASERLFTLPQCNDWQEIELCTLALKAGDNALRFYCGDGGLDVDYFQVSEA